MNIFNFSTNPIYRIKATHIIAIILLLINALIFTEENISIIIQLIIAFIITQLSHMQKLSLTP